MFILLVELSCGLCKDNIIGIGVENIGIVGLRKVGKSYIWGKAYFQGPPLIRESYPKGCRPPFLGYLVFFITISSGFWGKTQNRKTGGSSYFKNLKEPMFMKELAILLWFFNFFGSF
jgi:hypothetical protein